MNDATIFKILLDDVRGDDHDHFHDVLQKVNLVSGLPGLTLTELQRSTAPEDERLVYIDIC